MTRKKFNLTRQQSIKLICNATDHDDPYWEMLVDEYYDEKTDSMPTLYDVLSPIGITKEEVDNTLGIEIKEDQTDPECNHGQLKRSCGICKLEAENKIMRESLAADEDHIQIIKY